MDKKIARKEAEKMYEKRELEEEDKVRNIPTCQLGEGEKCGHKKTKNIGKGRGGGAGSREDRRKRGGKGLRRV